MAVCFPEEKQKKKRRDEEETPLFWCDKGVKNRFIKNSEMFPAVFLTRFQKENMMGKGNRGFRALSDFDEAADGREDDGKISRAVDTIHVWTVWSRPVKQVFDGGGDAVPGGFSVCSSPVFLLDHGPGHRDFLFSNVFQKYSKAFPGKQQIFAGHGRSPQEFCQDEEQEPGQEPLLFQVSLL